ncbi:cation diffusion facilitator family transporter [Amedibacillus sp. YH-ame10]
MFAWLINKFIQHKDRIEKDSVRQAYGNLASIVGIVNNIVLCLIKFIAGTLAQSVSITADAINNLSDAGSSVISLVSFRLSSKPADEEHPFGHARYECIASMIVACLILILGAELIKTSFDKILHPQIVTFHWLSVGILGFSIGIKLWMYFYNKKYGKLIDSSIMQATAADSISDVMATSAVLVSSILSPLIHFNLDGYMGVVVACFIIYAGYGIIRDALNEILGQAPKEELVSEIAKHIEGTPGVLGMHDLIVHDYGPRRLFASVHVEVDYRVDILKSHDMIDNMERDFKENMGLEMVIHMDPIVIDDPETNELRDFMRGAVKELDQDLSIHDFRIVPGETHTNMIFDVVVPYHVKLKNLDIQRALEAKVGRKGKQFYLVITFDRAYTA